MKPPLPLLVACTSLFTLLPTCALTPADLRTEYRYNPLGLDTPQPRLSWRVESRARAQSQSAWQIRVASAPDLLRHNQPDLWDSGRVEDPETLNRPYQGQVLRSGQPCFWQVRVWDQDGEVSRWSPTASWSMGLLQPADWQAHWISFRDRSPLHTNRNQLHLPPARHYRRTFVIPKPVKRATLHASALGLAEFHCNGRRVGDAWFEPGWSDYLQRAYYRTHDLTPLLARGTNTLGAIVADGWYAGYVGYGLLVGYGPHKTGRAFYGKTPALLAQLELEYTDGSTGRILTDTSWQVSSDGPIREADLIMGEEFDARRERTDWCRPGGAADWTWEAAIAAADNGRSSAPFSDTRGDRTVELGFQAPKRLQSYAAQPIRITEELKTVRITEPKPGIHIFDFGQNFAGVVRLKVRGPAGTRLQLRFGEMLHPDGRLMTENLRRARATDVYTLRGDPAGETWIPRFTYHGFQYAELTGLPHPPSLDTLTGLVLHNDTPLTSDYASSDPILTRFWRNTVWTQRANFIELPTDCPQRDERLGWMGDAQVYIRTATFNADVAAFFTKWLDDVVEAQQESGAYPDYCPYPMSHGAPGATFGTAWTDAGILCPWTLWQVYGDTRLLEKNWPSMTRFMAWRRQRAPDFRGRSDGNTWGDWLNVNEETPIAYVDLCFFASSARRMSEMAAALNRPAEAADYARLFENIRQAWHQEYLRPDRSLTVDSQSAYVLALWAGLAADPALQRALADRLAARIERAGHRMTTGFLGTKAILSVLTENSHHDLAVRLYQSRRFPSWGYEVVNGATTVWERWDSYTREHGFDGISGGNNASMNSFSHYAFGAVNEWVFRHLAGIDLAQPGQRQLLLHPRPPGSDSNPEVEPIHWVRARYDSPRGPIRSSWKRTDREFTLDVTIPANTTATVVLPIDSPDRVRESGRPLARARGVQIATTPSTPGTVALTVASGTYRFSCPLTP